MRFFFWGLGILALLGTGVGLVRVFVKKKKHEPRIPAHEPVPGREDPHPIAMPAYKHESFQGEIKTKIMELQKNLNEAWPRSYAEWEDAFRRDTDPEKGIQWFSMLFGIYNYYCEKENSLQKKREYFQLFMQCSNATPDTVLLTMELKNLSKQEAQAAVHYFYRFG
jgi:hypothetical protein